jgi:hypothetical protein
MYASVLRAPENAVVERLFYRVLKSDPDRDSKRPRSLYRHARGSLASVLKKGHPHCAFEVVCGGPEFVRKIPQRGVP